VIVPARNAGRTLGTCLDALAAQRDVPGSWELIVVDDGSSDDTAAVAGLFPLRLIRQPHRGAAAARNAGAAAARGGLLVFTDADCRPEPGWLAALAAPFADPGVSVAQGRLASDQRALVARFVQAEYEEKEARMLGRAHVTFADTASAAYRAEVFRASGGFREDLGAVEDTELAFRLAAAGHRLVMAPDALTYHRHPADLLAYARRKLRFGAGGARAYGAYPARVLDDSRTPWAMRAQLVLAPLTLAACAAGRDSARARRLGAASALAFGLSTVPFTRRVAERDQAVAVVAPALLFVRASCVGAGLALGLARLAIRRRSS
jgi:cellulose synthase/poly-beta-1,6-N-acetylglucosamine synthase-like glycosyltransferase